MAVRTQIYLPEELYHRLQDQGKATGKSMAKQIRESLVLYFTEIEVNTPKPEDPIWRMAGSIESKDHDLSARHDDYLYKVCCQIIKFRNRSSKLSRRRINTGLPSSLINTSAGRRRLL